MKTKNVAIIASIILLVLAVSYIIVSKTSIVNSVVQTPNCLDISAHTICRLNPPSSGYHEITGDCSSIGPSHKCYQPDTEPDLGTPVGSVCLEQANMACKNGYYKEVLGEPIIYCKISDQVTCPNGCDPATGTCVGGNPTCSNGYMECRTGNTWKCVSGEWQKQETCENGCTEETYDHATCNIQWWYCVAPTGCYRRSDRVHDCYATDAECDGAVPVYCVNSATGVCTKRFGDFSTACQSGESPNQGTFINDEWCNNYTIEHGNEVCTWYQTPVQSIDYGIFGWRHIFNNPVTTQTCVVSDWVYYAGAGLLVLIIVILIFLGRR